MAGTDRLTALASALCEQVATEVPSAPLVAALSGGADSAVATWALAEVASNRLRACFVDHGLEHAPLLTKAARAVAERLGVDLAILVGPVARGSGLEARARVVRFSLLRAETGSDGWVVMGHTAADQAETVLGNVLRGTGISGLAGMERLGGRVYRPLLGLERESVRELAEYLGLPFVDDPDNSDPAFRRNRLRRRLIPHLEADYNPGVVRALARLADAARADDRALERECEQVTIRIEGGAALVPAGVLTVLPQAVAVRVIRKALRMVRPPYPGTAREIAAVLAAAGTGPHRSDLGAGWVVEREGPMVAIHRPGAAELPLDPISLPVPGQVEFGPVVVTASPGAGSRPSLGRRSVVVARHSGEPLVVRAAAVGERIATAGGSKPVRDVMAEAGVPVRLRSRWPVVEHRGKIVWVAGGRAAVPESGEEQVELRIERTAQ